MKIYKLFALVALVAMVLAGCGTPAAAPAPEATAVPAAAQPAAPEATAAPAAVEPTAAPVAEAPTEAPAEAPAEDAGPAPCRRVSLAHAHRLRRRHPVDHLWPTP